ncbi:MAG: ABC transporter permease [Candidatus Symbiobacter sp.]|nr:ABC transporter permease [Candidatus Symbiobacter sp.]
MMPTKNAGKNLALTLIALAVAALGAGVSLVKLAQYGQSDDAAQMPAPDFIPNLTLILLVWGLAWIGLVRVVAYWTHQPSKLIKIRWLAPLIFGVTILFLWQSLTTLYAVPGVILPPPSAIALRLAHNFPDMVADLMQTIRAIGFGYGVGCVVAVAMAVAMDRLPFLERGLLPYGTLVSALPIVGIAPIMVMWFGFDWPSKAAVVIIMVFFPMLVNMSAGLKATSSIENDLLKTYGAGYWTTLVRLRLPASLPFMFNGLKISASLALIGAIVAEFFGTPIVGMGFRINSEVGRMNIDYVWATILVASCLGSCHVFMLNIIEKHMTFWHSSMRE